VQVVEPGGVTDIGLQVKPFKRGPWRIVTWPLLPATGKDVAVGLAAEPSAIWIVEVVEFEFDKARVTAATTPFGIAVVFQPQTIHVSAPATLSQVIDFPAEVATGPGATLADVKSTVE
jgi:hypothetical protein